MMQVQRGAISLGILVKENRRVLLNATVAGIFGGEAWSLRQTVAAGLGAKIREGRKRRKKTKQE